MLKNEYLKLIEENIIRDYNLSSKDIISIEKKNPREFFCLSRFDLIIKSNYIRSLMDDNDSFESKYIESVYKSHISAFTFGTFIEPSGKKKSFEDYKRSVKSVIESINTYGFDRTISLIPVNSNNVILDGAHRVAIAYILGKDIEILKLSEERKELEEFSYDLDFFLKRNMNIEELLFSLNFFIKNDDGIRIGIFWPKVNISRFHLNKIEYIDSNLNIIFKESYFIGFEYLKNLILHTYYLQDIIGDSSNNFIGANNKALLVYSKNMKLEIFIFDSSLTKNYDALKNRFRDSTGLEHSAIHITDSKEDTNMLSGFLFNSNSRKFYLNQIHISQESLNRISDLRKKMSEFEIQKANHIIIGSLLMDILGLRIANDVDILYLDSDSTEETKLYTHYFQKNLLELIQLPKEYLYFLGLKLVTPENLYNFKLNRNENKDLADIVLLNNLNLKFNKIDEPSRKISYISYLIINKEKFIYSMKVIVIKFLKKIGLYNTYRNLFKKKKSFKK